MQYIPSVVSTGAIFVAILTTAFSLVGFGGRYWWVGELLSQPRPQYALVLAICLPLIVWRFRRAGWLALAPILLNIGAFAPLYISPRAGNAVPLTQPISVLHYNLDNTLPDHTAAFDYLRAHPVDLLSLQEVTPEDAERLATELPYYEIAFSHPMSNSHGSALLLAKGSDIKVTSAAIVYLPEGSVRPIIAAELEVHGQSIAFLSLHVIRPVGSWNTAFQQIELAAAAGWSRQQQSDGQKVFMIGDLNSTSWSSNFRRLLQAGRLLNSEQGFGVQPTWPAGLPPIFAIPIDHCLYSEGIIVTERFTGPFLGSDHRPLQVQFRVAGQP